MPSGCAAISSADGPWKDSLSREKVALRAFFWDSYFHTANMSRLIYHPFDRPHTDSPFDEAIISVAKNSDTLIVSPYIGLNYLTRITAISSSWRLVSDIEAWLTSLSFFARPKTWKFIRENLANIHHCKDVHAKVVIGTNSAYLGSANLTSMGILARTEMGILLKEDTQLQELNNWFDCLWQNTTSPSIAEVDDFISWLDGEADIRISKRQRNFLSSASQKVRSKLAKLTPKQESNKNSSLNLNEVAKSLVAETTRHFDNLSEAFEASLEKMTSSSESFTFIELLLEIHKRFSNASRREIFLLLIQHCSNHPRSVFSETTINRLVISRGSFYPSNLERLTEAITPYDSFLHFIIHHLDFETPSSLPNEIFLSKMFGFTEPTIDILLSELIESSLLQIQDNPGELPQYRLEKEFSWEGRFKFFKRSASLWNSKKPEATTIKTETALAEKKQVPAWVSAWKNGVRTGAGVDKREAIEARHSQADKAIAFIINWLRARKSLSGKNLASILNTLAKDPQCSVSRTALQEALIPSRGLGVPHVFLLTNGANRKSVNVIINPQLDWNAIASMPQTMQACQSILEDL